MGRLAILLVPLVLACVPARGQIRSRAEEIEAARDRKAQTLQPDVPSRMEQRLSYIKDNKVLERITAGVAGFRLKLGGLVTGSGFALGPEYLRQDLDGGRVLLRTAAQSSFKNYHKFDLQVGLPPTSRHPYFVNFYSVYRNYPGIDYYGPGPGSMKGARSNFRLEDTQLNASAGVEPAPHLQVGAAAGYILQNIGPGQEDDFISTDVAFTPAQAAGIDEQANFFRHNYFARYDNRDNPGGPRSGGSYSLEYGNYVDRDLARHSFQRLELHLQQYIPFFNRRRVIAVRGKTVLTFHDDGQSVPFYLQPKLGGSDDLRGFRPYRFHDDNVLVANLEYRWETFSGLDMALFADAGKVFSRHADWNFRNVESSVGIGLRFNVRNNVFLRIDAGFSHEGAQFWVKFNNIFSEVPLGSPEAVAEY